MLGLLAIGFGCWYALSYTAITWQRELDEATAAAAAKNSAKAEELFKVALPTAEKLGTDDPRLATTLSRLAGLYRDEKRYADAEPLYTRALAIRDKALLPTSAMEQRAADIRTAIAKIDVEDGSTLSTPRAAARDHSATVTGDPSWP